MALGHNLVGGATPNGSRANLGPATMNSPLVGMEHFLASTNPYIIDEKFKRLNCLAQSGNRLARNR